MLLWLLHRWKGYVRLRLHGYSPERFLNLCMARKLELWGIRCWEGDYEFYMTLDDFRKVRPLIRKSRVRLRILERRGLPFFLYRHRKRKLFAAGLAGFFVLLYAMSLFIWDIQFQGNYHYTGDTLLRYLKEQQIDCGMMKTRVDCERLESGLRDYFPEITWVSARVSGTRLLIHIKENEVISHIPEKQNEPCSLVAARDGVITSMIVRSGIAQVSIGDAVEKGQVLVSGIIPIFNDNEEEVRRCGVRAEGNIVARTVNSYEKEIPLLHWVRVPTGRKKLGCFFKVGGWSMTLLIPNRGENQWDYVTEERQLKLFSSFYLPVYFGKILGNEVSLSQRFYTEGELEELSRQTNGQFAENLTEKGVQILENNGKIEKSGSICRLKGQLVTLEPIQEEAPIDSQELLIQNPEETKATE